METFTKKQLRLLYSLKTPVLIQNFLDTLKMNEEKSGDTCLSPKKVLEEGHAHCIEAAMLAAVALRMHGHPPLVMDLMSTKGDYDHVVTLFKVKGHWGALSKTNHAVLRYREPIYKTLRELALSYFHEYFLNDGRKTLRSFSRPVDLSRFDKKGWMTSDEEPWYIPEYLADVAHIPLLNRSQIAGLRKADVIERNAGKLIEWKNGRRLSR